MSIRRTAVWVHGARCVMGVIGCAIALAAGPARADIIYVDPDPIFGANNGTSWFNAYRSLHTALAAANADDELRLAADTYRPSINDRTISFLVPDGVTIGGGYAGWGSPDPDANDPNLYPTVLSGDLSSNDGAGTLTDNSYHVVRVAAAFTVTLQGLTVRGGNASVDLTDDSGAGIYALGATLTLEDCIIEDNRAARRSGGIYGGVLHMTNCIVRRNQTTISVGHAGGVTATAGSTFVGCLFHLNRTPTAGSAAAMAADGVVIDSCTFVGNVAGEDGGGIYGGGLTVTNSLFLDNNCGVYGGAISLRGGDSVFTDCIFAGNSSGDVGGAIYKWPQFGGSARIDNCHFQGNFANFGGAVQAANVMDFVRCDFVSNWTNPSASGNAGGAITIGSGGVVRAVNCRFLGQFAELQGGAVANVGSFEAVNCHFSGNSTDAGGAAVSNSAGGSLTMANCTINNNRSLASMSGGSFIAGAVQTSGASSSSDIQNCIVWGNTTAGQLTPTSQLSLAGTAFVGNCLVQDWNGALGGPGNSGLDPLLIDPDGADNVFGTEDDDPRIAANSPALDEGDPAALPGDDFDLDDDNNTAEPVSRDLLEHARVQGKSVDIGAVELSACPADISPPGGDNVVTINDLLEVINNWGPCPAGPPPSNCDTDISPAGGDGQVNINDLLLVINSWGSCP